MIYYYVTSDELANFVSKIFILFDFYKIWETIFKRKNINFQNTF